MNQSNDLLIPFERLEFVSHAFCSGLWSSGIVGVFNPRAPQPLTMKLVSFLETWWTSNPLLSKTAKDPNPQIQP